MKYKHDWNSISTPPTNLIDGCIGVVVKYWNGEEAILEFEIEFEDSSLFGFFTLDGRDMSKYVKGWKYL